ncbi:MAG: D-TA family PLP-dependent enzyme [Ardenticatenaceae bacterium]|nr:D-TA family PLP-dependent enzyme [Ardenticatenaceae bacterium]
MSETDNWYEPRHPETIFSPALLIYPQRIEANIQNLIAIAGSTARLRPHVKTHKMPQVVAMHQKLGITKLKCATIAEAEMVASCGVPDVLLAYQPVGPTQQRLLNLVKAFPGTQFGCLVDNEKTLRELAAVVAATAVTPTHSALSLNIWLDIDNGNGRTGIPPGPAAENLVKLISDTPQLTFAGLHVYDGHFAGYAIEERTAQANAAFTPVQEMIGRLEADCIHVPNIVAGGSPTFPVHAHNADVDLSPGTYVLWDAGYSAICPELPFAPAAVLLTRIISKPGPNRLCLDLGHKAVAGENPLDKRVRFLNAPEAAFISQSEEHLVIELPETADFAVGDILYGLPWHICPTVALHQAATVIDEKGEVVDHWPIVARNRQLTI